jgi:hypothetical protein
MLLRLTANFAVHAAAGVAVAGLAALAAEGWRRAARAGQTDADMPSFEGATGPRAGAGDESDMPQGPADA